MYQKYKTDNLRNVELLLLCFYAAGFLFEKCNFKVHLVCEINCLGGKHITCLLCWTLNAENTQHIECRLNFSFYTELNIYANLSVTTI